METAQVIWAFGNANRTIVKKLADLCNRITQQIIDMKAKSSALA